MKTAQILLEDDFRQGLDLAHRWQACPPDATIVIDHGGTPEAASPRQLNCGMDMFTLLDTVRHPLVPGSYRWLRRTRSHGLRRRSESFGQGAELHVERFDVRTDQISGA